MMSRISLRMRITLLTGVTIFAVSFLLTYASMYNAQNGFATLSVAIDTKLPAEMDYYNIEQIATGTSKSAVMEWQKIEGKAIPASVLLKSAKRQFDYWSYIYTALIAGVGMLASYVVAGRALAPVKKLSAAVQSINGQNLTDRIPIGETKDEVGELSLAFNSMLDRLEDSFERQKRFSSNVAHELKTPLATMKMSIQVGNMERDILQEELQQVFDVTERSVDRLIGVVDDLLTLTGEGIICMEDAIEVNGLLQDIAAELEPLYEQKGLHVETAFNGEACVIRGNAGLVKRIFFNLIENSMKYNRPNGVLRLITTETRDFLEITVADSGAGISSEDMERIFEPFYCVDPSRSRKQGGVGLGLSIVKAIVERHGWYIRGESVLGAGSSFTVTVPKISA